jgi:hypothetical protein
MGSPLEDQISEIRQLNHGGQAIVVDDGLELHMRRRQKL